ncbi:competence protein ComEA [Dyella sp. OK004]|uniref:ComEA family DNA-binding protein n=1 Tax=Dyella sp. OK004 TaxID=1855292 RepID=UPI0008E1FFDA|nr:helix-hairpin-helix domain-containing protein [Dyella sp. OK004]SFS04975.1 competence protein ComEA [Dyella sp. OK004]
MLRKLAAFALALAFTLPLQAATPVNVNNADATTIAKALDGIGPAKAAAIVAWRDEHGPFKSVDEVGQIKGVGTSLLERNRAAILLSGGDTAADTPAKAKKAKAKKKPAETEE